MTKIVELLKDALEKSPHPVIKYAAAYLITEYDRSAIPDWVEALANANLDLWPEAVDEIRRLIVAEDTMKEV